MKIIYPVRCIYYYLISSTVIYSYKKMFLLSSMSKDCKLLQCFFGKSPAFVRVWLIYAYGAFIEIACC